MKFTLFALYIITHGGTPVMVDEPMSKEECAARIEAAFTNAYSEATVQRVLACIPVGN